MTTTDRRIFALFIPSIIVVMITTLVVLRSQAMAEVERTKGPHQPAEEGNAVAVEAFAGFIAASNPD